MSGYCATFLLGVWMKRINVVGTSASGKSTFARQLALQLDLNYIELDDLFWLNDWVESPNELFLEKIQKHIDRAAEAYVIDGNYDTRSHTVKWEKIDHIIWLDLPFHLNLFRSVKRALTRVVSKQNLWPNSNNKESLRMVLTRDSIVWWMIKTHQKNRQKYLKMMQSKEYQHIQWIRLQSKSDMARFLKQHHSPK